MNELLSLLLVSNGDGVQVPAAADLELGDASGLLDGGGLDVLAAGELEELLDVGDFLLQRGVSKKSFDFESDMQPETTRRPAVQFNMKRV